MSDPFKVLAQARRLATGAGLDIAPPNFLPECTSEADFNDLVRGYYGFFYERLAKDTSFLLRLQPAKEVEAFRRLLYDLRTAANHTDNPRAEEAAARWRSVHASPQAAADALAAELVAALEKLGRTAMAVGRSPADSKKWREIASVEADAVFLAACDDLGLSFSEANRRRMVRLVEKRVEIRPRGGDRRALVAEYCVQEILSDRRPLPVAYDQVLDTLGVLGTDRASGAVLIAHSVAEVAPDLRGEAFLERVTETWNTAAGEDVTGA